MEFKAVYLLYSRFVVNISEKKDKIVLKYQPKSTDIFLFLHENIRCGYSLEAPFKGASGYLLEAHFKGASNEYPQHMFSWRN